MAAKWFLPETLDAAALRLLAPGIQLLAPDLLYPEVGNILWKRVRAGELTAAEAQTVVVALGNLPLVRFPSWPLTVPALALACQSGRTVYDSLYLALAVAESAPLVTADERLYNALKTGPLAPSLRWVEDLPP